MIRMEPKLTHKSVSGKNKPVVVDVDKEFPLPMNPETQLPLHYSEYRMRIGFLATNDVQYKKRLKEIAQIAQNKDVTLLTTKPFHRSHIRIIKEWVEYYKDPSFH